MSFFLPNQLILPLYHLVDDARVPHIAQLYRIKTVREFEKDLDFFLKYYTPIDYLRLQNHILNGEKLPKNAFLLTFDDGLRQFYDIIAPILQRKGIPAICFLNSDFVDNKALFFRYKASLLLDFFAKNKTVETDISILNWQQNTHFKSNLRTTILGIKFHESEYLDSLARIIGLNFDGYLRETQPYLTSQQITNLQQQGFAFGAHSCDHPQYEYLTLGEQLWQTQECMAALTAQFALAYRAFAFPFTDYGVQKIFFDTVFDTNKPILDLAFGCAGLKQDTHPQHLQRIAMEQGDRSAQQILLREYAYYCAKAVLGKNKIQRK
jgi:peptidoglycan/xylan/chitin deacetylase (PgdA/CDA1 family)